MYVLKPLIGSGVFPNMREFMLERNLTNVENVTKPLTCAQKSLNIRKFTVEKNSKNVRNLVKYLAYVEASLIIRKLSLRNVTHVPILYHSYLNMIILDRRLPNITNMGKLYSGGKPYSTSEFLLKNKRNVKDVNVKDKILFSVHSLFNA